MFRFQSFKCFNNFSIFFPKKQWVVVEVVVHRAHPGVVQGVRHAGGRPAFSKYSDIFLSMTSKLSNSCIFSSGRPAFDFIINFQPWHLNYETFDHFQVAWSNLSTMAATAMASGCSHLSPGREAMCWGKSFLAKIFKHLFDNFDVLIIIVKYHLIIWDCFENSDKFLIRP